ncbi:complex proteins associated with Set1p component shg1-domain-containing protein [Paraphoma chrysanthemicola]|nr:complex proteins associated with Set1p component shg1-domain-containing protein [Paraphoma chrysanthemicola]
MAEVSRKRALEGDGPQHMRKKLRPSELPLSQSKRSAIDNLVHTFRKKGHYDSIRKELLAQYEASPAKDDLLTALKDLVENETDRNPSLLAKDPRMATTLIEGAGERINIYGNIMNTVGELLDKLIKDQGLPKMREYRVLEIGAEAAAEEEARGSKTDEEWAQEAELRRQEREAIRERELEKERQIEREERAKKEERKRREKEQEEERERLRKEEKERRRKEREERDRQDEERRRKERERIDKEREEARERRKKEDEEHEKTRKERLERIRKEDEERARRIQEELDRSRGGRYRSRRDRSRTPVRERSRDRARVRDRSRRRSRTRSRTRSRERTKDVKPEDIKVDDDLALQLLLQESEQMKKSRQRPALERSESLEPPMRKAHPPKSLVPRDPVAVRLTKLEGKSSPALRSPSKEPATPAADSDVPMEDAAPIDKPHETLAKSRWDTAPPLPSKGGRTRSPSVAHSASMRDRSKSRSLSRGTRNDRRASRVEDDRRSRRDDDRHSYRPRDDRDDKRSRRGSRSRSRETHASRRKSRYDSRSPSPKDRDNERRRDRTRSPPRGGRRGRGRTPPARRRRHSRSRSPDGIDRYVPGGGAAVAAAATPASTTSRKREDSRDRKRDDSRPRKRNDSRDRPRSYRSRDYDRWEGGRSRGTRFDESDRYIPGGGGDDKEPDKKTRERSRSRDRDRGRDDRDRRRRARSRTRSRSCTRRR